MATKTLVFVKRKLKKQRRKKTFSNGFFHIIIKKFGLFFNLNQFCLKDF